MAQNDVLLCQHFKEKIGRPIDLGNGREAGEINQAAYCFDSKEQLLKWFSIDTIKKLAKHTKALLVTYDVPDNVVITGNSQDLFPFGGENVWRQKKEPLTVLF